MRRCLPALWRLLVVGLAIVAGGCSVVVDREEARLCRQIIAGLEGGSGRIEVLSLSRVSRSATALQGPGDGVAITYRLEVSDAPPLKPRRVVCLFDPLRTDLKPSDRMVGVESGGQWLTASRLYMLKRFWLDTIPGSVDPEPVPGAHMAPVIPRAVAVGAQAMIAGLPQMALLSLLAAAYALVYGLVGRINLAFGDLVTVGGYAALTGIALAGGGVAPAALAIGMAVVLALWACGFTSAATGRAVFEPLHHVAGQSWLIASAGLAIVLAEAVRLTKSTGTRSGPPILNDPLALARAEGFVVTVTPVAVVAAGLAAIGILCLIILVRRTSVGRAWRAASDDPLAAAMLGVSLTRVHAMTFAASGLLAGLGGAISAITYGSVAYAGGLVVGLKALMAALLAGPGAVGGAALCGLGIAVVEAAWSAVLPIEHRDAMLFTVLSLVLVVRVGRRGG